MLPSGGIFFGRCDRERVERDRLPHAGSVATVVARLPSGADSSCCHLTCRRVASRRPPARRPRIAAASTFPGASAASLVGCDATHRNHHVVTTVCSRLAPADCSHTTLAGHKAPGGECSAHKEHFFETASSAARAFARHRSDLGLAKPGAKRMGRIRVDRPRASCYGSNRR